jgi:hypothetical protein
MNSPRNRIDHSPKQPRLDRGREHRCFSSLYVTNAQVRNEVSEHCDQAVAMRNSPAVIGRCQDRFCQNLGSHTASSRLCNVTTTGNAHCAVSKLRRSRARTFCSLQSGIFGAEVLHTMGNTRLLHNCLLAANFRLHIIPSGLRKGATCAYRASSGVDPNSANLYRVWTIQRLRFCHNIPPGAPKYPLATLIQAVAVEQVPAPFLSLQRVQRPVN